MKNFLGTKKPKTNGYTIVEVLIVIAISSIMFIVVAISLGGRQQEVQFGQAVRDFDSKLNDYINDVSTGYFDNVGQVSCNVPVAPPNSRVNITSSGGIEQGTNDSCVFIGKVLQFAPTGGTDPASNINVYTVVGRRNAQSGAAPTNLEEARTKVVGPTSADNALSNFVENISLGWGLKVTKIVGDEPVLADVNYGGVGLFTTFNSSSGGNVLSNNESIRYGGIKNTNLNMSAINFTAEANKITSLTSGPDNYVNLDGTVPIVICLKSADNQRNASITIGGNNNTSTKIDFDTYNVTICGS